MKKTNKSNSEIHVFIIWEHARHAETKILNDIKKKFKIIKIYEVTWSKEKFTTNLSRFYGTNLPPNSNKEKHCGTGPFLAVIIEDIEPSYKSHITSSGDKYINSNLFTSKTLHREWTGGGHRIHGSNTVFEANQNLILLFGKNTEDLLEDIGKERSSKIEKFNKDLVGSDGWVSLEQLFYVLNSSIEYVVLRNFDILPREYYAKNHGDIDLLVSDYANACFIANSTPQFKSKYRVYNSVKINNEKVFFDFRFVGDNYYDYRWEKNILAHRSFNEHGFYVPSNEDYFYSLLYHALIQKPAVSKDYISKLINVSESAEINLSKKSFDDKEAIAVLSDYLLKKGYSLTQAHDKSVYTNSENVKLGMRKGIKFIKKSRTPLRNHLKKIKSKLKHYIAKAKRLALGQIKRV